MDADRWNRLNAVFDAALERDAGEREAFIREACAGDAALADEAARLLRAHERAPAALGTAVFAAAVDVLSSDRGDHPIGAEVGPYRLLEEIGRGGMGVVYLAERADQQYEKRVAIKLMKRGIDTDAVLRLFRHERQILAGLEHPNITRLLDGGTTADGRPYFVMEYVEGTPIDEYCDRQALSIPERLRLFRSVCAAVAYAHHHLVVHRDLKPSNILVTAAGEPKLLDFGIAKLLDSDRDGAVTLFAGLRPLTPEYASPEQLMGHRLTTLTDVYSLGLVLYELLAGRRALASPSSPSPDRSGSPAGELTRPSSIVRRPAAAVGREMPPETIAAARRTTPERLHRRLRGDLDTIVLTAAHPDPARRYQSVEALSEDIRRHLGGLPVQARNDALLYRAGKFARRHRAAVVAGTLVILSLVTGMIATSWQAERARDAQARAERRFNDVRKLANAVLFDYHDAIAGLPGATAVRGRLVQDALAYLDGLATESSDDPGLQRELAAAYERVADVLGGAHRASLGDTRGALESFTKALQIREALARAAPGEAQDRRDLAECHRRLGWQLLITSEAARGAEHLRRAVSLYQELAAEEPAELDYRHRFARASVELGAALEDAGDLSGALDVNRGAVAALEELSGAMPGDPGMRRSLSIAYENTARALFLRGDTAAALDVNARALAVRAALATEHPGNADVRRMLAISYQNDGDFRALSGDPAGGLASFRRKLAIDEELLAADPANAQAHHDLAYSSQRLGDILTTLGHRTEALIQYRRSAEGFGRTSTGTEDEVSRLRLAVSLAGVARTHANLLDRSAALHAAREAAAVVTAAADDVTNAHQRGIRAQAYGYLAEAHVALASAHDAPPADVRQHWRGACDMFQRSFDIWEDMRRRGILSISDAGKPDDVARELARCRGQLEQAGREAGGRAAKPKEADRSRPERRQ